MEHRPQCLGDMGTGRQASAVVTRINIKLDTIVNVLPICGDTFTQLRSQTPFPCRSNNLTREMGPDPRLTRSPFCGSMPRDTIELLKITGRYSAGMPIPHIAYGKASFLHQPDCCRAVVMGGIFVE